MQLRMLAIEDVMDKILAFSRETCPRLSIWRVENPSWRLFVRGLATFSSALLEDQISSKLTKPFLLRDDDECWYESRTDRTTSECSSY